VVDDRADDVGGLDALGASRPHEQLRARPDGVAARLGVPRPARLARFAATALGRRLGGGLVRLGRGRGCQCLGGGDLVRCGVGDGRALRRSAVGRRRPGDDLGVRVALDRLEVTPLLGGDQRDRTAGAPDAAGAADAVHVDVRRVRDVVVHDVADA
jgi:hypothetical protein